MLSFTDSLSPTPCSGGASTVLVTFDLHERVSEERERLGQTTSEYVANIIQEYEWLTERMEQKHEQ